ncbi:hypothetical protein [Streptomyces lydicamycinicus]|uniref:hypothetical protein n=1 Tax=Streptomyces lydicamycinicus TaxID=1546107 RepID=UPI003C2B9D17
MTELHEPAAFYWNANTDYCPHKPQPEQGTDAWDEWMCNHQLYDDGVLCLDAPAGTACPACSAEHGDMVPWGRCENREHARPRQAKTQQHRPVIADVGELECLERECEEFFAEDGDEIPGKTTCSHMRQMEICDACSDEPTAGNEYPVVVAWADCPQSKAGVVRR